MFDIFIYSTLLLLALTIQGAVIWDIVSSRKNKHRPWNKLTPIRYWPEVAKIGLGKHIRRM
jgi:hypothetical protein